MSLFKLIFWLIEKIYYVKSLPAWARDYVGTFSKPTPAETILKIISGQVSLENQERLCLFSHFDKNNQIAPHVVHYLKILAQLGFVVVVISTAEGLSEAASQSILPYVHQVIVRKNQGFDFGSWKTALDRIPHVQSFQQILFANDSVYGPLFDLAAVFNTMQQQPYDIWGITDCFLGTYHLQSYFLVFNQTAIKSPFFNKFWHKIRFFSSKYHLIYRYEMGLSRYARRYHLRIGAYCDYKKIFAYEKNDNLEYLIQLQANSKLIKLLKSIAKMGGYHISANFIGNLAEQRSYNATHSFWKSLVAQFNCPFLKVELLRDNPAGIHNVVEWPQVLADHTQYPTQWITDHLQRVKR